MATPSSVLAWRIPGTGEPCGLSSVGSHRVRHDWNDLAAVASSIKSQLRSLAAYHLTLSHTPSSSSSWCLCSGESNCYLPFPAQHQGFHSLCPSDWNALPSQLSRLQYGATFPLKPAQISPSQKESLPLQNSLFADPLCCLSWCSFSALGYLWTYQFSFCKGSSQHRNRTRVSHIAGSRFTVEAEKIMIAEYYEIMLNSWCVLCYGKSINN